MKYKYIVFLISVVIAIGLVTLASCSITTKKEEEKVSIPIPTTELDKIQMSFQSLNENTGTLYIIVRNNAAETFNYGTGFLLEKYENGIWSVVAPRESAFYTAINILLLPGEENEIRIALGEYYDSLSVGVYRLTKTFYNFGNVSIQFDMTKEMNF